MVIFPQPDSLCQHMDEEQAGVSAVCGKNCRRGTTAMEYLFVVSLILVVALTAVGYFGNMTKNVTQATADSITKSIKKAN